MSLEGKRILIVEDNSLNRVVYRITLGMQGAHIVFDHTGKEAATHVQQSKEWDLIILDLMLWGSVSGFDIFNKIRAMSAQEHIPIIAISASEPAVAMPRAQKLGFDGFISKPIDETCFVEQIEQVMNGEKVWYDGTFPSP
jgi:CheY-like chemotaxis protein